MTRYDIFDKLSELTQMVKTDEFQWNKMIQTGDLTVNDYGTGYLDLCIYYYKNVVTSKHVCRLWFGTIDDGCFGSSNEFEHEGEAKELVLKAVNFFSTMIEFSTDETLNEQLRHLGIYVTYE